ncbi:uncharacterized protein LOC142178181 [Nicotiana tabacum]|uniref:Uncharacterized protein LOC142178181 n=1 Tax=Nicotiana tabacum TaxID=4097 RepID=A0AC58U2A4_TOBAC
MELPWLVGGDFNVLLNEEEKIGGLPVYPPEYEDFDFCVNSCELFDTSYKGSPFTWWNGRPNAECIFKRLDKIIVNSPFQSLFPTTEVKHLIRTGSDHAPLFMTCGDTTITFTKPFKVVHDRMENILPSLISSNQSGFVKRKSIFENILLTQEIVTDIRLRGKSANVVIKLDMAKAYDRVSWKYLMHVLRKMRFVEYFINMIWNLISNNWYSVLINGQASRFFHSTRGVKQGDPLSPALFVLSSEVLPRSLNKLFEDTRFKGFEMPNWTDPLNHLAYVDDTIIFSSADPYSLRKIVEVLSKYEHTSSQMINTTKSSFYMHSNVSSIVSSSIGTITGFSRGEFSFTYLGCTIFYTRRRKDYYNDLIKTVKAKLHSWKGKLLSYGEKATLISSVLQSMPTHIISVFDPPKNMMPTPSGNFSVSSAWNILRHRAHANPGYSKIWTKSLPFKISFFLWRLWKGKIPTDDLWRRSGYMVVSKKAPDVITWELLDRRNTMKYGGAMSCNRVIHEVNKTLHYLARMRYPWLSRIPPLWSDMINFFEGYKPYVGTKIVIWQLPYEGWFKCNTDGASRGNHVPSSYGFCVRDHAGDLVSAKAKEIGETTNIVSEAHANVKGLAYCVEKQLHPLIMETDSLVMWKIIDGKWETPWCIGAEVHTHFSHSMNCQLQQKNLINMDKSQISNLRIRIVKRSEPD